MRMSCNGCRVLRKGCSDGCTIRPCLQWIKAPEAQANATVFLAKFYGRAGLLNLLAAAAAGPDGPAAVFRSLLYEACGRIVNPVYGSVGLLWSGQWHACQAAVEAVLKGEPVVRVAANSASSAEHPETEVTPPLSARAACDIRHVGAKDRDASAAAAAAAAVADLLRVSRAGRTKFKRASSSSTTSKTKPAVVGASKPDNSRASPRPSAPTQEVRDPVVVLGSGDELDDARALSHREESAGSHQHLDDDCDVAAAQDGSSEDTEAEAGSHVSQAEEHHSHVHASSQDEDDEEVDLELTLGLEPVAVRHEARSSTWNLRRLSAVSMLMG